MPNAACITTVGEAEASEDLPAAYEQRFRILRERRFE
jgi:hypothetical protein